MIAEGVGVIAPSPITVTVARSDCFTILREAKKRASFRKYAQKSNSWSGGLKNKVVDPVVGEIDRVERAIYCGTLGEWALSVLVQKRTGITAFPDFELRKEGDCGIDLMPAGLQIQIKTRQNAGPKNLVKVEHYKGIPIIKNCDAYVFCQWTEGLVVSILGWTWASVLRGRPVEKGLGEWTNLVILDSELLPMNRLIDEIRVRKERTCDGANPISRNKG